MKFQFKEIKKEIVKSASTKVYDITVEGNHSYCVDNVVVHNCGYPQLSALDECGFAVHGTPKGLICCDGGITKPGDAAKAFSSHSDFVMIGGYLAATAECDGEWELDEKGNKINLKAYGMSSKEANDKYSGGLKDYKAAEGKCVKLEYKGTAEQVLQNILGGIRSCCTYIGCNDIKDMPKCATFIKVNRQHNSIYDHLERKK